MKIEKSCNVNKCAVEIDGAEGVEIRWLISKDDGAENFSMRMFEIQPGFVYEGKEHEFGAEYVVFVPGGKEHCFKNAGDTVLRMLCLIPASAG